MHDHHHPAANPAPMIWPLALTLGFAFVEAAAGWWANSLALMGDAGHMLTDAAALGIAGFAAWASGRPASNRHTYGFARAELVAAFVNSLFMLGIIAAIAWAAIDRLRAPLSVAGEAVTAVAQHVEEGRASVEVGAGAVGTVIVMEKAGHHQIDDQAQQGDRGDGLTRDR